MSITESTLPVAPGESCMTLELVTRLLLARWQVLKLLMTPALKLSVESVLSCTFLHREAVSLLGELLIEKSWQHLCLIVVTTRPGNWKTIIGWQDRSTSTIRLMLISLKQYSYAGHLIGSTKFCNYVSCKTRSRFLNFSLNTAKL